MPRQNSVEMRLHGPWLVVARVGWSVVVLLSVISFLSSIPTYLADVRTLCRGNSCLYEQPTVATAHTLQHLGLSIGVYAAIGLGVNCLVALVFCVVAVVLIQRRPQDWLVLLISAVLISQALFEASYLPTPFNDPSSVWYWPGLFLSFVSPTLFVAFCSLFPSGRFAPGWMKWFLLAWILVSLLGFVPTLPYGDLIDSLSTVSGFSIIIWAQVYRYRHVSTPVERQQTKWVVYGVSMTLLAFIAWYVPESIFPTLGQSGAAYEILTRPLVSVFYLCVAAGITIAVLRYRLWDIDVLINRTLVYGSLTGILGAVYAALIIGLESLLGLATAQNSDPIALVVSTLLIAALFQPVRGRVQSLIDRRFYRRKYDAEKTLRTFSATLRESVELEQLCRQLLAAVNETMQPDSLSLWIRQRGSPAQEVTRGRDE